MELKYRIQELKKNSGASKWNPQIKTGLFKRWRSLMFVNMEDLKYVKIELERWDDAAEVITKHREDEAKRKGDKIVKIINHDFNI